MSADANTLIDLIFWYSGFALYMGAGLSLVIWLLMKMINTVIVRVVNTKGWVDAFLAFVNNPALREETVSKAKGQD